MARFALREYTPLPRDFAIGFAINENFHSIFEFLIALRLSCIYTDAMPAPWNPAP
jgi:hypothetical protein